MEKLISAIFLVHKLLVSRPPPPSSLTHPCVCDDRVPGCVRAVAAGLVDPPPPLRPRSLPCARAARTPKPSLWPSRRPPRRPTTWHTLDTSACSPRHSRSVPASSPGSRSRRGSSRAFISTPRRRRRCVGGVWAWAGGGRPAVRAHAAGGEGAESTYKTGGGALDKREQSRSGV